MTMRPYLLFLLAAFLITGCGSAEEPGKGAPKASAENTLSARSSVEKDLSLDVVSASNEGPGRQFPLTPSLSPLGRGNYGKGYSPFPLWGEGKVVSVAEEDDGAEDAIPNEDHLYIHAEEPPLDTRIAFLGPMDDYTEDAIEAKDAGNSNPDPSADETDCDYLSPGDPWYFGHCYPKPVEAVTDKSP